MNNSPTTSSDPQEQPENLAVLIALSNALNSHPLIEGVWITGSFAKGYADRYSDVDFSIYAPNADFPAVIDEILNTCYKQVLRHELLGGSLIHFLLESGIRVDFLSVEQPLKEEFGCIQATSFLKESISLQKVTRNSPLANSALTSQQVNSAAKEAERLIKECWRCIAMLPVVVARQELIVAVMGLAAEVDMFAKACAQAHTGGFASGVKRLNPFLPEALRGEIESLFNRKFSSVSEVAEATLALAALMQTHGPQIAERFSFSYPQQLEDTAMGYLTKELPSLLGDCSEG